jgi:hypothetical protein
VTPLERHCRWLLRAYPAWYRRDRAAEILDTLLEASPRGRRWPSFRDARALVAGGLRVRGWLTWCLSVPWPILGAAGAGYDFVLSAHVPEAQYIGIPQWVGESGLIYYPAAIGALLWVLLTIPMLVAGYIRLGNNWRSGAWTGLWLAGILLMIPVANWQPAAPQILDCTKGLGCALAGYKYAVISWGELLVFAAYLAVCAAMILMLRTTPPRRLRARHVPDRTVTGG